jgi:hypothetical protein
MHCNKNARVPPSACPLRTLAVTSAMRSEAGFRAATGSRMIRACHPGKRRRVAGDGPTACRSLGQRDLTFLALACAAA